VQINTLEIHPWSARLDQIDRPDRLIFDLDPGPDVVWHRVIEGAFLIHQMLSDAGLTSFVKTSGGKGLHIIVPIQRRHEWEESKAFAQAVGRTLAAARSKLFTVSPVKRAREGKIYLDCNRNSRGATTVAAYSTRNHSAATVSMPVSWEELSAHIGPDHFTVLNAAHRLSRLTADPWEEMQSVRQSITARAKRKFGV
jgi:bifunctional non-homologous end joining protein LigD